MKTRTIEIPNYLELPEAANVDITFAKHADGWRLWINVDGENSGRIYRIKNLAINGEPPLGPR